MKSAMMISLLTAAAMFAQSTPQSSAPQTSTTKTTSTSKTKKSKKSNKTTSPKAAHVSNQKAASASSNAPAK